MKTNFTKEELTNLLEAQDDLNKKYTGEDWRNVVPIQSFLTASFTEVAEYLESGPRVGNWKWWKSYEKNDTQNLIVEAIDVLHFNLSCLMKIATKEEIIENDKPLEIDYLEALSESLKITPQQVIIGTYCTFNEAVIKGDLDRANKYNNILMLAFASQTGKTIDDFYSGYFKKNQLNHKRLAGGYMEGTYKKIDEDGNEDNRALDL